MKINLPGNYAASVIEKFCRETPDGAQLTVQNPLDQRDLNLNLLPPTSIQDNACRVSQIHAEKPINLQKEEIVADVNSPVGFEQSEGTYTMRSCKDCALLAAGQCVRTATLQAAFKEVK